MEQTVKTQLNKMSAQELQNAKAHAELADKHGETHESHTVLSNWAKGLGLTTATLTAAGGIAKLIKIIKNH